MSFLQKSSAMSEAFTDALVLKFPGLKQRAADEGWILALPIEGACPSVADDGVLENHVLTPSPYFKDAFVTLGATPVRIHGNKFCVGEGESSRTVNILSRTVYFHGTCLPMWTRKESPPRRACAFGNA